MSLSGRQVDTGRDPNQRGEEYETTSESGSSGHIHLDNGIARKSGVGGGAFGSFADGARQMVRPRAAIEPDEAAHARYAALFEIYRDLYPQVRPLYERLSSVR
mgnify:CR=1 FL=1